MVPVYSEALNLVGFVKAKHENMVGAEAAPFVCDTHKIFNLGAPNGHVRLNGVFVGSQCINRVAKVRGEVDEQIPDGLAKLLKRTAAIVAEGQKMHRGIGDGQTNHAGGVEVVIGRKKRVAGSLAA